MKTILFPTDFSVNAQHAFRFATKIAREKKAKLILLHTYDLPLVAPVNDFTSRNRTMLLIDNDLKAAAKENMKIHSNELNLKEDNYEVLIKEGSAVNEIVNCCEKEKVELIVMGTKGETNNRDFLIGSITAKAIEKVKTPLLVIPEFAKIQEFKNIVFAADLMYNSVNQINKALNFCKSTKSSLTFLHIRINSENEEDELKDLRKIIEGNKELNLKIKVIQADTVKHGIESHLQENKTDLLILSNHTKSFFEKLFHKSVSKQMVMHGKVPMLIFSNEHHPKVFF